ncbi:MULTISPECIES: DUF4410 domain-containing protein [unclassified Caballeronia]|uniref:DUF4410 domain-containing protein n=1 Tax=unclassified Caballeronia TaxID=2646786 RepID=UPI002863BA8F|nr:MULTISPECIES: DUF4410 domain-containing protein [unclassified Caballeronia]MDR5773992.1 DUF4410 domain-containing protein [Caballeronia sp. LZ002]MDR5849427.1 DUF4410 domain-containing protein [Caballeronia sp. LZ003]
MFDSIKTPSLHSLLKLARRVTVASLFAGAALMAGCANANAQTVARPDVIYVYAFHSDASQVKLDQHGLASKLSSAFSGDTSAAQQAQDATAAREEVANEIVAKLQAQGLRAIRADVAPPDDQNVLAVVGDFSTIDAGNRRRRVLIGLGAGESQVGANVQLVFKPAHGAPQVIEQFDAKGDSGHAPGVAEMAGVGAAAGHVASSLAVSGGMHAVSETKHADVSSDEKRLGDAIAKEIAKVSREAGWTAFSG